MTENYLATKERLAGDARRAALEREDARKIEKQRKELARKTKLAKGVRPGLRQRLHEAADRFEELIARMEATARRSAVVRAGNELRDERVARDMRPGH